MSFRIQGLPVAAFAPLFGMGEAELSSRGVVRRVADKRPGFPCRVSLRDAQPGESVLLLNYEHLPVSGPYRSRHAVYVREYAHEYIPEVNEIPEVISSRLLSVRAFDASGMMVDADVVAGDALAPVLDCLLADPEVAYLHLHNAKPGCFAARVVRV
ncbi:MAG TPA: DUF1203 domain-containing protein [Steroidobacteraceae bacterium]|nr:DUF1203 domain-containing protein [Steroidobacteraceae bacterium]